MEFSSRFFLCLILLVSFLLRFYSISYRLLSAAFNYIIDTNMKTESWKLVAQSCPTLCNPMDCSPPGSSVHGILQARVLESVAISFSRGSSQPRDQIQVSCIPGRFFTIWANHKGCKSIQSKRLVLHLFLWSII